MLTLAALTVGLVVWIFFWAIGWKPVDSFLLTLLIVLPAAAWQIFGPGIKKLVAGGEPPTTSS
jgi:hypothetical protein